MPTLFLSVFMKVAVLFLMIAAGYACGRKNLISDGGAREMTSVLFWVVTPCVIISSLQGMAGEVSVKNLLISGVLGFASISACILFSLLLYRREPKERRKVLRFATAYSNCGFMGLPLAQAVLGDAGAAYASVFIAAFNLLAWTHGVSTMREDPGGVNLKKAVINPGVLGFFAGFLLFAFSIRLPELLLAPIRSFSELNTPLAMLVVGVYVSRVPFRELFTDRRLYGLSAVRLLVLPAVCFLLFLPFHVDRAVFTTTLILTSSPAAANSVMFAAQFGGDTNLGSKAVALTTLFSAFTMPLFPALVGLAY